VSALDDAFEAQIEAVREWLELLEDPFKAPEQRIGLPAEVWRATFEASVQYEMIKRLHPGRRLP